LLGHFCDDGKGRSQNQHKKRKQNPLFICMVTLRNVVMTSKMMKYAPGELVADKTNASLACFIM